MANLTETAVFDPVYQLETADPVLGGPGGISNRQAQALTNRTALLKQSVDALEAGDFAPKASPAFTGNPTAPTAASGDKDTSIANTAFVENATGGMAAINVAGAAASIVLTAAQAGSAILQLNGARTDVLDLILPTQTGQWVIINRATGDYNITAKTAAGTGVVLPAGTAVVVYGDGEKIGFASSSATASFKRQTITGTTGATLNVNGGYTPGNVIVEKNGILLEAADFAADSGSTITLVTAAVSSDVFTVYAFSSFTVANAILRSGDNMAGPLALFAGSTAPTPAAGDKSTAIATTAFVAGAVRAVNVVTLYSSGTYTPPANLAFAHVAVQAGGGGGGGAQGGPAGNGSAGGGGGAGGYAERFFTAAQLGANPIPVTVGGPGSGGTGASASSGAQGGNSTFLGMAANGGGAGLGRASGSAVGASGGRGIGGAASGGFVNAWGAAGTSGLSFAGSGGSVGGAGGSTRFGAGGSTMDSAIGNGDAGIGYGSGGGGGSSTSTNANGGIGVAGLVIITEYLA